MKITRAFSVTAALLTAFAVLWSPASTAAPATTSGTDVVERAAAKKKQVGVLRAKAPGSYRVVRNTRPAEVGLRFKPKVRGRIIGARVYKGADAASATPRRATLWNARGKALATASFSPRKGTGWRKVTFSRPVKVKPGKSYTISVFAPKGRYAVSRGGFSRTKSTRFLKAPAAANGVRRLTKKSRFPRPTKASHNYWVDVRFVPRKSAAAGAAGSGSAAASTLRAGWPGPNNTGVPSGTTLKRYTGPCTITQPTTLDGVDVRSTCDALLIRAADVKITRSLLPRVDATDGGRNSVTLTDSTVRGGQWQGGSVWGFNITAHRIDVTGGQHSFQCNHNCTVTDSWLHDQWNPDGQSFHNNAFISNGGSNMVIRHNTLHCTALLNRTDGGCTADLSLFGDFEPIRNVTIDNNLFKANNSSISYCLYGGHNPGKPHGGNPTGIVVTDNVFERGANDKCGVYGPVTSFRAGGAGNTWSGNKFTDGAAVNP